MKPRNRAATAAIMRKGGPHGKTRKAERKAARQTLTRRVRHHPESGGLHAL